MTEHDKKMGEELLKEPFIQKHPEWVKELEGMMKSGEKAEIQALSSFGFQFITEQFLPRKLLEGDWIWECVIYCTVNKRMFATV